eukprot:1146793-Pelagomonas_calceolata.AAC.6
MGCAQTLPAIDPHLLIEREEGTPRGAEPSLPQLEPPSAPVAQIAAHVPRSKQEAVLNKVAGGGLYCGMPSSGQCSQHLLAVHIRRLGQCRIDTPCVSAFGRESAMYVACLCVYV